MTKALSFAIAAPILYAFANVILEYKFSKYNNLSILVVYTPIIVALAVSLYFVTKTSDVSYTLPAGNDLWLLVGIGVVFFVADYLFIGAYTNGGDLITITILTLLFPVFASLFKYAGSLVVSGMVYAPPNVWQISGYILAAVAILFVVKGNPSP